MPELPEIETLRRGLERETVGRRVKSVDVLVAKATNRNGSRKAFQAPARGRQDQAASIAAGPCSCSALDTGELLVFDVGETGTLVRAAPKDDTPKDTAARRSRSPRAASCGWRIPRRGPRRSWSRPSCCSRRCRRSAELGLDPVASPVSWTAFAQSLVNRRSEKLKALLLDPTFVVGLGGLYADEILYDAGLRPDREVSTVSTMEIRRLYRSLVEILHEATKHHGTSTDEHPFTDLHGKAGELPGRAPGVGPRRRAVPAVPEHRHQAVRSGGKVTLLVPELPGLTDCPGSPDPSGPPR